MVRSWFNGMECDRLCFHLPDTEPSSGGRKQGAERERASESVSAVVIWIHN